MADVWHRSEKIKQTQPIWLADPTGDQAPGLRQWNEYFWFSSRPWGQDYLIDIRYSKRPPPTGRGGGGFGSRMARSKYGCYCSSSAVHKIESIDRELAWQNRAIYCDVLFFCRHNGRHVSGSARPDFRPEVHDSAIIVRWLVDWAMNDSSWLDDDGFL